MHSVEIYRANTAHSTFLQTQIKPPFKEILVGYFGKEAQALMKMLGYISTGLVQLEASSLSTEALLGEESKRGCSVE